MEHGHVVPISKDTIPDKRGSVLSGSHGHLHMPEKSRQPSKECRRTMGEERYNQVRVLRVYLRENLRNIDFNGATIRSKEGAK